MRGDHGDTLIGGEGRDYFEVVVGDENAAPVVIEDLFAGTELGIRGNGSAIEFVSFVDENGDFFPRESISGNWDVVAANGGEDAEVHIDGQLVAVVRGVHPGTLISTSSWIGNFRPNYADTGTDVIQGSEDADFLRPFAGDDTVFGNGGDDSINPGNGDQQIFGGDGDDTIWGGLGSDDGSHFVDGGSGDDYIICIDENDGFFDTIIGGEGDDTLAVNDGDVATGGPGADDFEIVVDHGIDSEDLTPVLITDFDPTREGDVITLITDSGYAQSAGAVNERLTLEPTEDGSGAMIIYYGVHMATIEGVPVEDLGADMSWLMNLR